MLKNVETMSSVLNVAAMEGTIEKGSFRHATSPIHGRAAKATGYGLFVCFVPYIVMCLHCVSAVTCVMLTLPIGQQLQCGDLSSRLPDR